MGQNHAVIMYHNSEHGVHPSVFMVHPSPLLTAYVSLLTDNLDLKWSWLARITECTVMSHCSVKSLCYIASLYKLSLKYHSVHLLIVP